MRISRPFRRNWEVHLSAVQAAHAYNILCLKLSVANAVGATPVMEGPFAEAVERYTSPQSGRSEAGRSSGQGVHRSDSDEFGLTQASTTTVAVKPMCRPENGLPSAGQQPRDPGL